MTNRHRRQSLSRVFFSWAVVTEKKINMRRFQQEILKIVVFSLILTFFSVFSIKSQIIGLAMPFFFHWHDRKTAVSDNEFFFICDKNFCKFFWRHMVTIELFLTVDPFVKTNNLGTATSGNKKVFSFRDKETAICYLLFFRLKIFQ